MSDHPRNNPSLALPLLTLLAAVVLGGCGDASSQPWQFRGQAMGTTWRVTVAPPLPAMQPTTLRRAIADRIEQLESQMSHWRPASAVSRFNRMQNTEPVAIAGDLAAVIAHALRVHKQTGGAFDITLAPLINIWGFGPAVVGDPSSHAADSRHPVTTPSDDQIAQRLQYVGSHLLGLTSTGESSALRKLDPRVQIDLSALAKGYAIDAVAAMLADHGVANFLIELGGELRASGDNAQDRPWRVGLEHPSASPQPRRIRGVIKLGNAAIATSGSYRLFFETAPTSDAPPHRFTHILDPRTGRPVTHDLVSVSVIADTAMHADAMATALMVLGPTEGFTFAADHNLAATFVERKGDTLVERFTTQWAARTAMR